MKEARKQKHVPRTQGARQVLTAAALDWIVAGGASDERLLEQTIETTPAAYMRWSMLRKKCSEQPELYPEASSPIRCVSSKTLRRWN